MGNNISILGAGWLGGRLAEQFAAQGDRVNLGTRSSERLNRLQAAHAQLYQVDIEALADNIQDFLNAQILIINITCKNVMAFNNLLQEIEKSPVEKLVFVSSTSVYPADHGLCQESDELDVASHPLLQIEKIFTENPHFQTTILRFAGLIGPQRHPGRFFSSGKKVRDPQARVNLIHLDDCLRIIKTIIDKQAWGEVFNACADSHPSKRAYYTLAALSLGRNPPEFLDAQIAGNKVVSNHKLKALLDYQFIYPHLEPIPG
ncbi:MAG: NAD-dependent epimerase/dehydratase family protein [Psychromonas sp.]|nr:NAD-dependent epimerase/dehydratase family protein [Psychromonas sp.]